MLVIFLDDYLDLAYSVAKDFPDVDFYAYTKMASVSKGSKPSNFKMNFIAGADPSQEKQMFKDLINLKYNIILVYFTYKTLKLTTIEYEKTIRNTFLIIYISKCNGTRVTCR